MGFLDRAKKLAQQAKGFAEDQVEKRRDHDEAAPDAPPPADTGGPRSEPRAPKPFGTPSGALGERWKSLDLGDPAGVVPPKARAAAGVPTSTLSEVVKERYGIGRRWSAEGKAIGVLWLIDPDNQPDDASATGERFATLRDAQAEEVAGIGDGAYVARLGDAREGVFVTLGGRGVVIEVSGIPRETAIELATTATENI